MGDVLISNFPYPAWSLLMDFLALDKYFCNNVFPKWFGNAGALDVILLPITLPLIDIRQSSNKWRVRRDLRLAISSRISNKHYNI